MRSIRRRKQIRDLVRKAKNRGQAPPQSPPAPQPASRPAGSPREVFCVCGKVLSVGAKDPEQTISCAACKRKVKVLRVGAPGLEVLQPIFLEEPDATALEGLLVPDPEPGPDPSQDDTEEVAALIGTFGPGESEGPLDPVIEPEPPDQIFFFCPGCRAKLAAIRTLYDRRARCSECESRVLINLVFDRAAKMFDVRLVRLGDPPTGLTGIAPAVS